MLDRRLAFLDVETTGAAAHYDRITEIGLVEVDGGRETGAWSSLINPQRPIPPEIESLTGITAGMVESAPTFAELAPELHRRLAGRTLVAHNARFDAGFLKSEFRRAGLRYEPDVLCTVRLSRRLYPAHKRHNLDSLIERHGLACETRHRALADARVLWDFTQSIHREFDAARIHEAVTDLLRKPMLPPALPPDLLDQVPEAPGVYAFLNAQGATLHVGKSMNLRARLHSHFSGDRAGMAVRALGEVARVEWREAAGPLGVQIRFLQWVRTLRPAGNRKPRHDHDTWALRWDPVDGPPVPEPVDTAGLDTAHAAGLHGMFRSRRTALNALRRIADEHGLCHIGCGLESGPGPCLGHRLKTCRGLCVGTEPRMAHSMRLMQALHGLRVRDWPYDGAAGFRENNPLTGRTEIHVFDGWRYLGSVDTQADFHELAAARTDAAPDAGFYRLLSRHLRDAGNDLDLVVARRRS
ncbi:MAG TPA: exonuclease domain-containing protein [Burkholderiales bacterium]|nr:exonuclease domain-containing protein [Burkholderiales bacterium]